MLATHSTNLWRHATGLMCLGLALGCNSGSHDTSSASVGQREQHLGRYAQLSAAELATYKTDMKHLHSLMRPDVPVRLNLADDAQYRFVLTRMKLAGKNAQNAPHLFELIEKRRQQHLKRNPRRGLAPGAEYVTSTDDGARVAMHFLEATSLVGTSGASAANSTFPEGSYYTYVDTAVYDAGGLPLSDLGLVEEFDGGYNTNILIPADLSQSAITGYTFDSYKMEDTAEGFEDSYVVSRAGTPEGSASRVETPDVVAQVRAPADRAYNDGIVSICLDRSWLVHDCDYDLKGEATVKVPLEGSLRINSNHHFSQDAINRIRTELDQGRTGDGYGHIKLLLATIGGACNVKPGTTLQASMRAFWHRTSLSADGKTLSWSMTDADSAFFHGNCRLGQDRVKLTMRVPLPIVDDFSGVPFDGWATLSNEDLTESILHRFPPIKMVNSCLAEGTRIQLADGRHVAIEDIELGDRISNPYHAAAQSLTVMDIATGSEKAPMVRVEDASGRSLRMTETHPIQTTDRGMVLAKHLSEGDTVMTASGPSKLVAVEREPYGGKVYNLKVGSASEMAEIDVDQTAVYANGFLVGDGQIQSKYEAAEVTHKEGDVLDRLPAQWHRDYQIWSGSDE
jgi:hypothetical protein